MTLGQKLKKLRTEKGLTQKALADQLHVTFQTVSKWESGLNEPDIATLKELSKVYDCSIDYLLNDKEDEIEEEMPMNGEDESPVEVQQVIIHQKEMHVCTRCHKDIPENELVMEKFCVRPSGRGHSAEYRDDYYHRECFELTKKERARKADETKRYNASKAKKKCFGWGIFGGLVTLVALLLYFLLGTGGSVNVGLAILYSVLGGYSIFAMLYCILSGSYIADVFLWCASLSIKFPGIIFSWDLGGFVFLIAMKLLFVVLGFLIGVFALIFAVFLSAALSTVSFPFVLIHNVHTQYEDAL